MKLTRKPSSTLDVIRNFTCHGVGLTALLLTGLTIGTPVAAQVAFEEIGDAFLEPEESLEDVLGEDAVPGFSMLRSEDSDLINETLNQFRTDLDAGEWEKAFRSLIDLSESTQHMMSPLDDSPVYVPVRRSIQERLRGLPPQGRRAFQQFYDAQAREMLLHCRSHDEPGSDAQLEMAQKLYELFFMTSSGDAAANLLGDLYFERGAFASAQACWESILTHHPGSSLPEVELQFKRVIALHRAGQSVPAHALAQQVALRFAGREVPFAGGRQDASQALASLLGAAPEARDPQAQQTAQRVPSALPERGADPLWQMTFEDDTTKVHLDNFLGSGNFRGPTDLRQLLPPTATDDHAVYAHWHGVVFAMDLDTGKMLWRHGQFSDIANTLGQRMTSAVGNPRGYKIALTDRLVIVQSPAQSPNARQAQRFSLVAYDKETGQKVWDSADLAAWQDLGFCGQPIVVNGDVYAITHSVGAAINQNDMRFGNNGAVPTGNSLTLTLHRLDASTGIPAWSLPLGQVDPRAVANSEFSWMPQPMLHLHERNLYILTNNGALIAVDTGSAEVAWAMRLRLPEGGNQQQYYTAPPPSANAQGPGAVAFVDGTLYIKEARSPRIYAIDPDKIEMLWEREAPADSEMVGIDRSNIYVMAQAVRAYPLDPDVRMAWNNAALAGPTVGSALLASDLLYVLGGNKLRALSLETGDPEAQFTSRRLRGHGGRVSIAGDKIICVTRRDITVYQVPTIPAPLFEAGGDTPEN